MDCISPVRLKTGVFVPCGNCNFCLQKQRAQWTFRLKEELKVCSSAFFLTLTYSHDELPVYTNLQRRFNWLQPSLCKIDVQRFMKRLRKLHGKGIRYYFVGEYGTRGKRPHYHCIIFNLRPELLVELDQVWSHGHVRVGSVTPGSIHYTTKYHLNKHREWEQGVVGSAKPFALMSNGIGSSFIVRSAKWHKKTKQMYVVSDGVKQSLPRYYKEKIFNVMEKEVHRVQSMRASDRVKAAELARLELLHPDAFNYVVERERFAHERVRQKENLNDKF